MSAASRPKPVDKHALTTKLVSLLRKRYPYSAGEELPVLETLLYAVCLENLGAEQAAATFNKLTKGFYDFNEIRVSSIEELGKIFDDELPQNEWRALRSRTILQYVFESNYAFDLEAIKRKTAELAAKQLGKIQYLTPFIRNYAMQHVLGSHVLPIDDRQFATLVWLGLAERNSTPEHAGEALRGYVRKADGLAFCACLRGVATDRRLLHVFSRALDPKVPLEQFSPSNALARLEQVMKSPPPLKKAKEPPKKAPVAARAKAAAPKPAVAAAPKPVAAAPKPPATVVKAEARPKPAGPSKAGHSKAAVPAKAAGRGDNGKPAAKTKSVANRGRTASEEGSHHKKPSAGRSRK